MNELGGSTAPPLEATAEPKSLTQADVRRLHDEIGRYAHRMARPRVSLSAILEYRPQMLWRWYESPSNMAERQMLPWDPLRLSKLT